MAALDDHRAYLRRELERLEAAGLRRRLRPPQGIDLTSNDILGFADHPHLRERMLTALASEPAGAGASRLLRGHLVLFDDIEERLAAFCGAPAALLFNSGYAANTGLLQTLLGPDDLVLSDAANHASLIDGIRLSGTPKVIYPHQDLTTVEDALHQPRRGRVFIVTESLFGMDGDLTPLVALVELAERHGALVIVDEAHATGLFGPRGAGRVEELGLRERVLATVHTGGKALGSSGAWVAGSSELRELLVNRARSFVFTTAPLPVLAAALHAGLDLVEREPQRRADVRRKSALLRTSLRDGGVTGGGDAHIVPLMVGENAPSVALQAALLAEGFDARAVRPPTVPPGTARLRVSVRYPLTDAELERFAAVALRALREQAAATHS
jgi:8-amino-7-oxononanoate synthase